MLDVDEMEGLVGTLDQLKTLEEIDERIEAVESVLEGLGDEIDILVQVLDTLEFEKRRISRGVGFWTHLTSLLGPEDPDCTDSIDAVFRLMDVHPPTDVDAILEEGLSKRVDLAAFPPEILVACLMATAIRRDMMPHREDFKAYVLENYGSLVTPAGRAVLEQL